MMHRTIVLLLVFCLSATSIALARLTKPDSQPTCGCDVRCDCSPSCKCADGGKCSDPSCHCLHSSQGK